MKSVLISIQPKWCELIASGKKTVEVRKTKPKLETPFKVYIYCTKGRGDCLWRWNGIWYDTQDPNHRPNRLDGKVIGEFVCDAIFPMSILYSNPNDRLALREFPFTCLTDREIIDYLGNGGDGYGWHISDLVIYDEPRELREFFHYCGDNPNCDGCEAHYYSNTECGKEDYCCSIIEGCKPLKRPFQSWGYVYEADT